MNFDGECNALMLMSYSSILRAGRFSLVTCNSLKVANIDVHIPAAARRETSNTAAKSEARLRLIIQWLPLSFAYHHYSNISNFLKMP